VRSFLQGARKVGIRGVPKTVEQVRRAFAAARNLNWKPYDQATYRNIVMYTRKFYKFLGRRDVYEVFNIPRLTQQRLTVILTEEEVSKLIKGAENMRDRVIIEVLWETACRVGELVNIKIKDITFDEHGARIILRGKIGERIGRVVIGKADLLSLVNNHPLRHNGNAPLFLGYSGRLGKNHPLERIGVEVIVHKLGKQILNRDDVHPHMLRHSRATQLSKFLTDRELKILGGWKSDVMPPPTLQIRIYGCGQENAPTAIYCNKCGKPLAHVESESRIKELEDRLRKIEALYMGRLNLKTLKEEPSTCP